MSTEALPLDLFKANLELHLRITRLAQENSQRWLEVASRAGNDGVAESSAEIENLLKAENWQALAALPTQAFWRQFQQRVGDTQTLVQAAVSNQTAFTQGLQQAVQEWQKAVNTAAGSADAIAPLQDLFKQWGAAWTTATDKEAAAKGGASRGK